MITSKWGDMDTATVKKIPSFALRWNKKSYSKTAEDR